VRRRLGVGVAAAAIPALAVASSLPAHSAPAADWSRPHSIETSSGLTVYYPHAWSAMKLAGPSLAVSSFTLPNDWWLTERKTIPDGGIFVWAFIAGPPSDFPRRPARSTLPDKDRRFMSCGLGFEGWNVIFTDRDATVQAFVGLGRGARKADATELLDRLTIASVRPSLASA
jgi:hypothetical protein